MLYNKNLNIKKIIGDLDIEKNGPFNIFDENIIDFINEISKYILRDKNSLKFPDLVSFGFWCRIKNIKSLQKKYKTFTNRVGRGSVLHIAPSNVPTNFAYSMIFGLLSGNNNIIRLPSKNFFQVKIITKFLKKILLKKKFKNIKKKLLIIKYDKSDVISSYLSEKVEARIIWGGDSTINKFKTYYTNPRCIDICFADRFSVSIIDSNKLKKLNKKDLNLLANRFFNDTYTMDQFGCSSPNTVFWLGKNQIQKKKFWMELKKIVDTRYDLDLSSTNKKISNLINFTISKNKKFKADLKTFSVIKIKDYKIDIQKSEELNFGTFFEVNLNNLRSLKNFTSIKLQTVTYFGLKYKDLIHFITENNIKGIDRVVPIGRSFDLTTEWDGTDIINSLSRTIGI